MTPTHPPFPLPNGITEADLIDLADGVLTREREGDVLAAVRQDPRIGLLARQFRADRETITGLGGITVPTGLAEGIEARLEAAAILDLSTASRQAPATIPISQIAPPELGNIRSLLTSVWTRRLAVAASLAIVAGLGVWGVFGVYGTFSRTKSIVGIGGHEKVGIVHNDHVDNSVPVAPAPIPVSAADVASAPHVGDAEVHAPVVASVDPAPAEMTDARAAHLASEGRLAITLRVSIAAPTLRRLDALARARDNGWRAVAVESVPTQYAALLTPATEDAPAKPTPNAPAPTTIAGDNAASPAIGVAPAASSATLPRLHPVVKGMYTVDLAPGDKAFASLIRSIADALPAGVKLSLRELPRPISAPVAVDPESVLWWSAGAWSRKAALPIVVEGLE
jgi:hypothetical protein